jgi:hypothetical protein
MIDINPPPVKLICSITFSPEIVLEDVYARLEGAFGLIDDKSETINFTHTDYYLPEMGPNLKKLIVSFENPFRAENLWLAKRTTIDIEYMFKRDGKRRINLDPGYLEASKLVLASTKNFSHRVYLNEGIWAEVTLIYADHKFQKLPWTYPDYLDDKFMRFLERAREQYKNSLR